MYTNNAEAAYVKDRIERATALASKAPEDCARLAHEGMANLYKDRLAGLKKPVPAPPMAPIKPA